MIGNPEDADRLIEALGERFPTLQSITVAPPQSNRGFRLYFDQEQRIVGVRPIRVSYRMSFQPLEPEFATFLAGVTGVDAIGFGEFAWMICTECDPPRPLGYGGCPHE
ncbi:MAG TPA: hypothetical protein VNM34_09035 [Verrucomicrobiae bacterium]|nr:hypothetical protein [Verrucomicrobiae bacterium]